MLFRLFRRREGERAVALYGRLVAKARDPHFYAELGVPDTVEGRLELVLLHCGLVVARLGRPGGDPEAGRRLAEAFFSDMDRTLREMGTGDLSVPKKMKKIAAAFYGRLSAYEAGLSAGDEALSAALVRNVWDGTAPEGAPLVLAAYVRRLVATLDSTTAPAILDGTAVLPDPAAAKA